jgi:hypothetical protein
VETTHRLYKVLELAKSSLVLPVLSARRLRRRKEAQAQVPLVPRRKTQMDHFVSQDIEAYG